MVTPRVIAPRELLVINPPSTIRPDEVGDGRLKRKSAPELNPTRPCANSQNTARWSAIWQARCLSSSLRPLLRFATTASRIRCSSAAHFRRLAQLPERDAGRVDPQDLRFRVAQPAHIDHVGTDRPR